MVSWTPSPIIKKICTQNCDIKKKFTRMRTHAHTIYRASFVKSITHHFKIVLDVEKCSFRHKLSKPCEQLQNSRWRIAKFNNCKIQIKFLIFYILHFYVGHFKILMFDSGIVIRTHLKINFKVNSTSIDTVLYFISFFCASCPPC